LRSYGENVLISRFAKIYNPDKLIIGNNSRIDDFCILTGEISVGSFVHIAPFCLLQGSEKIVIDDFAGLSSRVSIYSVSEDYTLGLSLTNPTIPDEFRIIIDKGIIVIEKHVLIGSNSIILPNTSIHEGSSIGAFSLLRGEYESWKIYSGIPAKKVGQRRSKTIVDLEQKLLSKI
jgi:galactoside O-acetyltransferase